MSDYEPDDYVSIYYDQDQSLDARKLAVLLVLREMDYELFPHLIEDMDTLSMLVTQTVQEQSGDKFVALHGDLGPVVLMGEFEVLELLMIGVRVGQVTATQVTSVLSMVLSHARPYYRLLPPYQRREGYEG